MQPWEADNRWCLLNWNEILTLKFNNLKGICRMAIMINQKGEAKYFRKVLKAFNHSMLTSLICTQILSLGPSTRLHSASDGNPPPQGSIYIGTWGWSPVSLDSKVNALPNCLVQYFLRISGCHAAVHKTQADRRGRLFPENSSVAFHIKLLCSIFSALLFYILSVIT